MSKASGSRRRERKPPPPQPLKIHRFRVRILLWAFILAYAVIGGRLVLLQVDPDLKFGKEDLKHIGMVDIQRPRGTIHDRNGRVLATNRKVPSISANPSSIDDPRPLAAYLSRRLGLEEDMLLARLSQRDAHGNKMKFVWIKRWLRDGELEALGDVADIPGGNALAVQQESCRFYPEGDLASHVLGFANREGQGAEGVELAFDGYLRSRPGRRIFRVDNKRNFLGFLTLEHDPPSGGDNIHLTLDASLQYTLEEALDRAMEDNEARRAMGILMDPGTGAILALASRPAFDPNRYWEFTPEERKNRAVVDVFEPGSAFKIVTASAALEHGFITPDDEIDCENGRFNPYGHRIRDTHDLGVVSFSQAFTESSNIAIIKVAALLGPERLESWIRRYGFGRRTGLDLPGESPGIFHPRRKWSRLSMGSLPMGQEVAVTLLQLCQAYAAIANGGYYVQPYVVERAVSDDGQISYRHEAPARQRVMSEETALTMKALCHRVVSEENGTGWQAAIPEYRVCGKTGTAQIARTDGRGYYKDKYTTIFAGFAPMADPKICAVIVVQEPMVRLHYGGYVCGPVFKEVVREALVHLRVPQDPMLDPSVDAPRQNAGEAPVDDADTVVARLDWDLLEPLDLGLDEDLDGLELLPYHGDSRQEAPALPSFLGMTKREAKMKIVALGLPWDPQGAGRVVRQEPPPGTLLQEVSVCQLVFSNARPKEDYDI